MHPILITLASVLITIGLVVLAIVAVELFDQWDKRRISR